MQIRTLAQGFDLTPAIDEAVRTHFGTALHPFSENIETVDVHVKDLNGPRGGEDKQVIATVHLRRHPVFSVSTTRSNLYAAIVNCSKRCKRRVRRTLGKARRIEQARLRLFRHDGAVPDAGWR